MKRISIWAGILVLLALALIVGVLTWLFVGSLFERGVALWGLVFVILVAAVAGAADWFTRESHGIKGWARLREPRSLARMVMAVLFGLGMALFAQSFLDPKETDVIKAGVGEANRKLDTVIARTGPKPWRAFEAIAGDWGEEGGGCRVVYRFTRQDHGLSVDLVKGAEGLGAYRMTASIIPGGEGDVLRATLRSSTETDEPSGQALLFTYSDDGGGYRRLDWLNESRSDAGALKLEPCGVS